MFKFFWVWEEDELWKLDNEVLEEWELESDIWQLALDIIETPNEIIILSPIAWINLEDIDLSFSKSILTIKWFRWKPEFYYESSDIKIRNTECFWWKFIRNIILPENLDFDSIKASMENNLLIIKIKKLNFESQSIKIDRIEI